MTNGCFDILHAGHVAYLREAASLGDLLVVAVNSDASVARLKGADRPVNTVERRLQVLAGLEAVDAVIAFENDTPIPLIDILRPDVLVKGGGYNQLRKWSVMSVFWYGGEVKVLGEVGALSTSHLIAKIRQTDSIQPADRSCASLRCDILGCWRYSQMVRPKRGQRSFALCHSAYHRPERQY